ncbi:DUF4129 domain-containing transglutaminase family protein [Dehalogenimonas alkenigignens]|uniref:Transglutaminase-like domain-containing protein n=1 Tax=Dehalogenimonas alkenigignens TaxID=1217799 RepID=A0A0W0GHS5_9CHLR|nr:transglutaminase domain-containing protein [Dehalogenimonas alkenigignens]KTB48100.1 Transglutaminase-like superfamily/Domain of unknown function (DUF4129) [Dehalogenimonas alkenigignens]
MNVTPVTSRSGFVWLNLALVLLSLGVAVYSLEAARWINPQPSLLLPFLLGVAAGSLLGASRLPGAIAAGLSLIGAAGMAVWQSLSLFSDLAGLSKWDRWLEALSRPSDNQIAFAVFLVAVCWLAGVTGAWFAARRRNGWPAFIIGALIVSLNVANLTREFEFIIPLYLVAGLVMVAASASNGRGTRLLAGLPLCLLIVLAAFALPQSPAADLKLQVGGESILAALKDNTLNIFSAVPSKVKTVRSSNQDSVSFSAAPDQSDAIRFIIDFPTSGYFTTRYYDTYSAAGWTVSQSAATEITPNQPIIGAAPPARSIAISYQVENQVKTDLILVNGYPLSVSIPVLSRSLLSPEGNDIMTLISPRLLAVYQTYQVTGRLPAVTAAELALAAGKYPDWIAERYLQLPSNLPRSVSQLSRFLTRDKVTAYEKVMAVKEYLGSFSYEISGTAVATGADGVAQFIASRQGNCVNFASAAVVLLRSAGIPARFCQGYLGIERDADTNRLIIRGHDSHTWAEVYFPDYGWIVLETTPGRPADSLENSAAVISGDILPPPPSTNPFLPGGEIEDTAGAASLDPAGGGMPETGGWVLALAFLLPSIALAAGGGTLYLSRASSAGSAYARLGLVGRLFRLRPNPAETPLEYARRLSARLPSEAAGISAVAGAYARVRYGPAKTRSAQDDDGLRYEWRQLSLRLIRLRFGLASPEN